MTLGAEGVVGSYRKNSRVSWEPELQNLERLLSPPE